MRALGLGLTLGLLVVAPSSLSAGGPAAEAKDSKAKPPKSALDFTVVDIDGKAFDLRKLKNKVVMIVNVASR